RPDAAAIRIVVRAALGTRGKLAIRPPLMLHAQSGNGPDERSEMITNGLASLFGD
ncbi:methyltransferase, partial [Mesorhizobium sp. M7A.F.Ca.CA.001.05.1.1]